MIEAPFALAFTAGLVATVNPCGFAMLPAYRGYFLGTTDDETDSGTATPVGRGLVIGAIVSSGFLVVFGVAGLLVTLGLRSLISAIPWAAMLAGYARPAPSGSGAATRSAPRARWPWSSSGPPA